MDPNAVTRPTDCALALAIPWTRDDFLAQLQPASPREFARWYREALGGNYVLPETAWTMYEQREARVIARLLDECDDLGVHVSRTCTLAALVELAKRCRVVILVAHWRTGLLQPRDILDRSRFLAILAGAPAGALAALRSRLEAAGEAALLTRATSAPEDDVALAALLRALSAAMERGLLADAVGAPREVPAHRAHYRLANRELLAAACGRLLGAGAGLELHDATHAAHQVAAALGGGFEGLIDMAVCNSFLLATAIKRLNPSCLIMANREETAPLSRLLIAREVLETLARRPASYVQVALDLRARLRPSGPRA